MSEIDAVTSDGETKGKGTTNLVYIFYLTAAFLPLIPLIGFIVALTQRNSAPPLLRNHYQNQVNLFIRGIVLSIGVTLAWFVLTLTVVGEPIALIIGAVVLAWWYVRTIKGMKSLSANEPIADLSSWGF